MVPLERTTSYTDSWYPQPAPLPWADRTPTSAQWVVAATVWLLAAWTRGGAPGWRAEFFTGTAIDRSDQQWPEPPPLPQIARAGGFAQSGPGQPISATVLTSLCQPAPGRPYERIRPETETTAEIVALLVDRIPAADPRGERLRANLAKQLVGRYTDLLRVSTGGDDLHLVQRDSSGKTLRLTVAPAPEVEQPPQIAADGADAALRTRLACLMTLLSDLLWVNNTTSCAGVSPTCGTTTGRATGNGRRSRTTTSPPTFTRT